MNIVTILLIVGGVLYLLGKLFPRRIQDYVIHIIDDQHFTLTEKDYRTNTNGKTHVIYWKNLQDVQLNQAKDTLVLTDISGKVFQIHKETAHWHALIQDVPASFANFDHQFVTDFLASKGNKVLFMNIIEATPFQITYEVSSFGKIIQASFDWRNVVSAQLNEDKTALKIALQSGDILAIPDSIDNWYWLLKHLPERFEDAEYIKAVFESFVPCDICGHVAVLGNECQACYEETWQQQPSELYSSKEEFIKERQLEVFGTHAPLEKVNYEVEEGAAFEKDLAWKPSVSEEEILYFSQENYWGEDE
jgi:hypothetical protein